MKPIERRLKTLETREGKGVTFPTLVICKAGETNEEALSRVFIDKPIPPEDELIFVVPVAAKPPVERFPASPPPKCEEGTPCTG